VTDFESGAYPEGTSLRAGKGHGRAFVNGLMEANSRMSEHLVSLRAEIDRLRAMVALQGTVTYDDLMTHLEASDILDGRESAVQDAAVARSVAANARIELAAAELEVENLKRAVNSLSAGMVVPRRGDLLDHLLHVATFGENDLARAKLTPEEARWVADISRQAMDILNQQAYLELADETDAYLTGLTFDVEKFPPPSRWQRFKRWASGGVEDVA
jgi:hypothetical protein